MHLLMYMLIIIVCSMLIGRVSTVFIPCQIPAISQLLFGCEDDEDEFEEDMPEIAA